MTKPTTAVPQAKAIKAKQPRSYAVNHEIALLEVAAGSESAGLGMEQIRECFAIFDDIIPKLGVYQVR